MKLITLAIMCLLTSTAFCQSPNEIYNTAYNLRPVSYSTTYKRVSDSLFGKIEVSTTRGQVKYDGLLVVSRTYEYVTAVYRKEDVHWFDSVSKIGRREPAGGRISFFRGGIMPENVAGVTTLVSVYVKKNGKWKERKENYVFIPSK